MRDYTAHSCDSKVHPHEFASRPADYPVISALELRASDHRKARWVSAGLRCTLSKTRTHFPAPVASSLAVAMSYAGKESRCEENQFHAVQKPKRMPTVLANCSAAPPIVPSMPPVR